MYTSKVSSSKFMSPRDLPQTTRASGSRKFDFDASTSGQQDRIRKILNDVRRGDPLSANAILIPQSELARMKSSAAVVTKEELLQHKRILDEQNEKRQAAAKAKKQKMLDIESERKKQIPPSEIEMENNIKNDALRERAKTLMDEEKDDVKQMNQMILYAKVVTVRDSQLLEKTQIRNQYKNDERRKDLTMEIERLKKIKYYEEQDRLKREEQQNAAMQTIEQIRQRELVRLRDKEEREREGQDMLRKIKDIQKEESDNILTRRHQQKLEMDEIFHANQRAIANKNEKIQKELEEEEQIIRYNIEKAQKEADYQAEQKRIKDAKEKEIQKLRALQEKAQDRQAEIDSLRAKRASEHADRLARDKERREAETRARINAELLEARRLQSLQKEMKLQEQAKQERDEFHRIVQNQKIEREVELMMDREKKERVNEHANQLKKQMAVHEEKKKQSKKEFLEEGKKIKDNISKEKNLLENIKTQKLGDLMSYGIPNKYTSELARKRIIF